MFVVGITGPARAGKTSVANELFKMLHARYDWHQYAFADPIKDMIKAMGIDSPDDFKTKDHPIFGVTTREMYQTLGTEWAQGLMGKDVWIKALKSRLSEDSNVIISDVRFEREANFVRTNGVLIHVVGRGGIEGNHSSEAGINTKHADLVIDNSGTWESTVNQLVMAVRLYNFDSRILRCGE